MEGGALLCTENLGQGPRNLGDQEKKIIRHRASNPLAENLPEAEESLPGGHSSRLNISGTLITARRSDHQQMDFTGKKLRTPVPWTLRAWCCDWSFNLSILQMKN